MTPLTKKALTGLLRFQFFLALMLFIPAGSLHFWEAWVYWIVFFLSTLTMSLYLLKHDPALVERRMKAGPAAETEQSQKTILIALIIFSLAICLVPGFDHRWHWSHVPTPIVLAADIVVVAGWLFVLRVFRENSFAASTVTVEAGQHVISTGPYALVRHPMYTGSILSFLATPLALGSFWALIPAVLFCAVIIIRLLDEERYLSKNLPGYTAYCQQVRHHLIPYIW